MSGMDESQAVRRINGICDGSAVYKHIPTGKRYYQIGGVGGADLEMIPISGPSVYITAEQLRDSDAWEKQ